MSHALDKKLSSSKNICVREEAAKTNKEIPLGSIKTSEAIRTQMSVVPTEGEVQNSLLTSTSTGVCVGG